jgi:uncharacterized membrane protein YjgN (DUF898 family)
METPAPGRHAIQFTGTGSAYFGIWIVNLALTILTFGLYSPWAKVRRLRYFYGNTLVDGSPFEFNGSPVAMLKGRLIAAALLVAYTQSSKVSFSLWAIVVAAIGAALPWLLWKSLRFRLANSSYRGIRFGFDGSLREAYLTFVLPILLFVSPAAFGLLARGQMRTGHAGQAAGWVLGLTGLLSLLSIVIAPWLYLRIKRYQHGNALLGSARFYFSGTAGDSYVLALKAIACAIGAGIVGMLVGGLCGVALFLAMHGPHVADLALGAGGAPSLDWIVPVAAGVVIAYLLVLGIYPIVAALTQNFVWGKTGLDADDFVSTASGLALWRIDIGNFFLVMLTLGLYWPFAVVRNLRYRLSTVRWTGDPATLLAGDAAGKVGATGEEAADLLGFDLGL